MGDDDSGEKTEEPTPHKLREARKKGQIAKSKDVTASILIFVSFFTLKATAVNLWQHVTEITKRTYTLIPEELTMSLAGQLLQESMMTLLTAMAPLFLAIFVTTLIVEFLQTGFLISFESMAPSFEKLNPIEGFKKLFALKQVVELIKSLLKMAVVIYLIVKAIQEDFIFVILSQEFTLWQMMNFTGNIVMKVVTRVGVFYFIIAILDYFYQRYEWIKGLRMSKKEIKDEYKRLEGDPTIKQRQRETQRQMSQGRQMGAVPDADVVVTNPVHIAIAIEYKHNKMKAPRVLAKGKRLVAESIKALAEQYQIPIVENPPLAQDLYKKTDINKEIPPQYYKAVAEILAFVYNLKKKKQGRF